MKTSEIILCITFLWTAVLQLQRSDAESADATNCMPCRIHPVPFIVNKKYQKNFLNHAPLQRRDRVASD